MNMVQFTIPFLLDGWLTEHVIEGREPRPTAKDTSTEVLLERRSQRVEQRLARRKRKAVSFEASPLGKWVNRKVAIISQSDRAKAEWHSRERVLVGLTDLDILGIRVSVLMDALHKLEDGRASQSTQEENWAWVLDNTEDEPFAFRVCARAALCDPDELREMLLLRTQYGEFLTEILFRWNEL